MADEETLDEPLDIDLDDPSDLDIEPSFLGVTKEDAGVMIVKTILAGIATVTFHVITKKIDARAEAKKKRRVKSEELHQEIDEIIETASEEK